MNLALSQTALDDWNELRWILAVARAGSLVGAARALGVDHSTVFRRLQTIEARLGEPLFERGPGGTYSPTATGERIAAAGERMEDEALALARDLVGRDSELVGRLRVASSETLAFRSLTRHIADFRRSHPGIVVELTIDNRLLSLARREADVALRPTRPKEGELWGRKLADLPWSVYGARAYLGAAAGAIDPARLAEHPIVGWDEGMAEINAAAWLAAAVPPTAIVYRSNSLLNQFVAVKAGIGLAALPCYLGDREADLARAVAEPVPELARELWIVTHPDLRRTARVRAFLDEVGGALAKELK